MMMMTGDMEVKFDALLTLVLDWDEYQLNVPAALFPEKEHSVPPQKVDGWASEPVWWDNGPCPVEYWTFVVCVHWVLLQL
jgi:hypothetical protein